MPQIFREKEEIREYIHVIYYFSILFYFKGKEEKMNEKIEKLCGDLIDNLTVIKGYLDLGKIRTGKGLDELREEIESFDKSLKELIDEIHTTN
ncbi:hypothetical protein REC12_07380 [Desulfosporosinus sp. PR]|uniref:hypothetical protein n=1 Tax=Candidatus Desulfosporosinus nitrosoreducens TaxID=3401928 RepID=UPI0027F0CD90|nr:hypothetical protein [Desulfosporosinus sp. PR]MDQ7093407.1 hypothetical protein [Desulfosporosinus sp. PR]